MLIVCRDLEFRVNNRSINDHGGIVEVCIDDQWHEARFAIVASNPQLPRNINFSVTIADSPSVTMKWSGQQSIPSDNITINGYDLSCTTSSLSDYGQIHEVRVPNISTSTTRVQVSGLATTRHGIPVLCQCTHTDKHSS